MNIIDICEARMLDPLSSYNHDGPPLHSLRLEKILGMLKLRFVEIFRDRNIKKNIKALISFYVKRLLLVIEWQPF